MKKLNIGIIAHVDAGKTTLTENILFLGGAIAKTGRVDKGDTQTDSMAVERRRGISVKATTTSFCYEDIKFNLIDTPGHVDFVAEVERSLSVLDGVVLVISAREGLQSQTRILMDTIMAQKIPTVIFINKIDRMGVQIEELIQETNEYMNERLIITQQLKLTPESPPVITSYNDEDYISRNADTLYMLDDDLMEQFVNNKKITTELFNQKLVHFVNQGELYPVFFGSALHGIGVECLLSQLPFYLPVSIDDNNKPLSGVVFKVDNSGRERQVYVRLYQGSLNIRKQLKYRGKEEKVTRLSQLVDGKIVNQNSIEAGDIGILYVKDLKVGDVLGEMWSKTRDIRLARPTFSVEVYPKLPEQKRAMYEALTLLADEDPLLDLYSEKKLAVKMFGEIQLEILKELLLERYNIPVSFSDPVTIYMETPLSTATAKAYMFKDGIPYAATVGFRVEPLPQGSGLQYVTEVSYGDLEKTFQVAVEEAVLETCKNGMYGWEVTDAKVVFNFSEYNSVDSTPSDYRNLTPIVLMEAFIKAGMGLLEPYLDFELRVPLSSVGKALNDLRSMNAIINETKSDDISIITGLAPVDECKNYGTKVASYTEGQGVFLTKFHGYRDTEFTQDKVNEDEISIAANKTLYLMHKRGVR